MGILMIIMEMSNSLITNLGDKFSVSFAFNRTSQQANSTQSFVPIVTIPLTTNDLIIGFNKNSQKFGVYVNGTEYLMQSSTYLGMFNHITLTVDNINNTLQLFFNGNLTNTINLTSALSFKLTDGMLIGLNNDSAPTYMFGQIDDLVFMNKIYNTEEALKNYWQWYRNFTSYVDDTSNLGIKNTPKTLQHIKVYPNPTSDFIKLSEKANVQIFDSSGRLLQSFQNVENIDITKQKQGIYILKISNDKGTQTSKVIKK